MNRDNLGVLIDILHFTRSRTKLEELDGLPRGWYHFAHVCDAPKEIPATVECRYKDIKVCKPWIEIHTPTESRGTSSSCEPGPAPG